MLQKWFILVLKPIFSCLGTCRSFGIFSKCLKNKPKSYCCCVFFLLSSLLSFSHKTAAISKMVLVKCLTIADFLFIVYSHYMNNFLIFSKKNNLYGSTSLCWHGTLYRLTLYQWKKLLSFYINRKQS